MRFVDVAVRKAFFTYGRLAYGWRWTLLLVPLLSTAAACYGFRLMEQRNNRDTQYLFTPTNGRAQDELRVFDELWPLVPQRFLAGQAFELDLWLDVLVTARLGDDVLHADALAEIDRLDRYLSHNVTVPAADGRQSLSYQDLCLNWAGRCAANEHVALLRQRDTIGQYVRLTFPKGGRGDTPIYLGSLLGGVSTNDSDQTIVAARALRLSYFLRQDANPVGLAEFSRQWRRRAAAHLLLELHTDEIVVSFGHDESLSDGIDTNAARFVPNFAVCFTTLALFASLCSYRTRSHGTRVDWVRSKPWLALGGVISAAMAAATALGSLMLLGCEYNVVVTVMPFLIVSIGVDDVFLTVAAWARTSAAPTRLRLAQTLSDSAVSISITSLTDLLSFGVGCLSVLPGVSIFCMYTAVAITLCYVYHLTFFTALLAFFGDFERDNRHAVCLYKIQLDSPWLKKRNKASKSMVSKFFRTYYTPTILHPISKFLTLLLGAAYLLTSLYGISVIEEGLNPKNLVPLDFYMRDYFEALEIFWNDGPQLHVAVSKPPNLANQTDREYVLSLVAALEESEYGAGRNATMFWLYEYQNFLDEIGAGMETDERRWYENLRHWFEQSGARTLWRTQMRWTADERLDAFRLQVGLVNFVTPHDHKLATSELRRIADSFAPLGVTVYHQYFPYADQYLMILPATAASIALALLSVLLVSAVLLPRLATAAVVLAAVLSINVGVVGFLAHWHVNLDCVSMISVVMCIGFAVDLSAHVGYAYAAARGSTGARAAEALEAVGWPVVQGAMSSVLGTLVLASVQAYIILTIFKTVMLVMFFGMLHSLLFLPVALTTFFPGAADSPDERQVVASALTVTSLAVSFAGPYKTTDSKRRQRPERPAVERPPKLALKTKIAPTTQGPRHS